MQSLVSICTMQALLKELLHSADFVVVLTVIGAIRFVSRACLETTRVMEYDVGALWMCQLLLDVVLPMSLLTRGFFCLVVDCQLSHL